MDRPSAVRTATRRHARAAALYDLPPPPPPGVVAAPTGPVAMRDDEAFSWPAASAEEGGGERPTLNGEPLAEFWAPGEADGDPASASSLSQPGEAAAAEDTDSSSESASEEEDEEEDDDTPDDEEEEEGETASSASGSTAAPAAPGNQRKRSARAKSATPRKRVRYEESQAKLAAHNKVERTRQARIRTNMYQLADEFPQLSGKKKSRFDLLAPIADRIAEMRARVKELEAQLASSPASASSFSSSPRPQLVVPASPASPSRPSLFEQSPEPLAKIDASLRVLEANPALARLLGAPRGSSLSGVPLSLDSSSAQHLTDLVRRVCFRSIRSGVVSITLRAWSGIDLRCRAMVWGTSTAKPVAFLHLARDDSPASSPPAAMAAAAAAAFPPASESMLSMPMLQRNSSIERDFVESIFATWDNTPSFWDDAVPRAPPSPSLYLNDVVPAPIKTSFSSLSGPSRAPSASSAGLPEDIYSLGASFDRLES